MSVDRSNLTKEEKRRFESDGFIVRNNLLSADEVEEVKTCLKELVRKYAPDRERCDWIPGKANGTVTAGDAFRKRGDRFFFQLESGQDARVHDLAALELQVRKFMCFENEAEIFQKILGPEAPMLSIVEELIEDRPLLFQSMALIKPPKIGATKPWHQDNAYFSVTPLESVIGVWIAIDEATVKNGCMHMLRGQHKQGPLLHEHKRDCEINVRRLDLNTLVPVPLKPGGALFFSGMVPHETPPNRSDKRRRALQFHFRGSRSTIVPGPEYDEVFKDAEGNPASCEAIRREGV